MCDFQSRFGDQKLALLSREFLYFVLHTYGKVVCLILSIRQKKEIL